jgi:hypothetical protein
MPYDSSYASMAPSTIPLYGGTVAVSAMTAGQAAVYLSSDVSGGTGGDRVNNGLLARLAEGRNFAGIQDHADRQFIKRTFGI